MEMGNPDVKALKKRMASVNCLNCRYYNERESYCEQMDRYLDGSKGGCEKYEPARIVKFEKRVKKVDDE